MPEYVKRTPATKFTAHRYQFGELVEGELLGVIRRSSIEAEAVEVPQWRSLLIRAGEGIRDVVLVGDGMWLVYEHDRGYLTAWEDTEFRDTFASPEFYLLYLNADRVPYWEGPAASKAEAQRSAVLLKHVDASDPIITIPCVDDEG